MTPGERSGSSCGWAGCCWSARPICPSSRRATPGTPCAWRTSSRCRSASITGGTWRRWRERLELHRAGPRTDFPAPAWEFVQREPFGVCAGSSRGTSPYIMAVWKAAPALATGNTMVLKPRAYTPITALELAGGRGGRLPAGRGQRRPRHRAGRRRGARHRPAAWTRSRSRARPSGAADHAARPANVKKVTLELGGKAPTSILDDADLDIAIPGRALGHLPPPGPDLPLGHQVPRPRVAYDEAVARMVELAETCGSAIRDGLRHRHRPAHRPDPARHGHAVRTGGPGRGGEAPDRRGRTRRHAARAAATSSRRSSARSTTGCASPRRRSSGRCSR